MKILVADDDRNILLLLENVLNSEGYDVVTANDGTEALIMCEKSKPDAAVVDLQMPGMGGIDVLRSIRQKGYDFPIIIATAYGSIESTVEAMREGAYCYLTKPFNQDELILQLGRALEREALEREVDILRDEVGERYSFKNIIGESAGMRELFSTLGLLCENDATVLITGETGTGKELVARALHYQGTRKNGPFVAVNCGAIAENLVESHLFGHEKGSFTGASGRHTGKVEAADGGTLFLDEVGELPMSAQTRLLRVLQEREVERIGGDGLIPVDIRVICATHRNLEELVKQGKFREDLYFRINVVPITIPPLRERPDDIMLLVNHFLTILRGENRYEISPEVEQALRSYAWPGNVRELENIVERLTIFAKDRVLPVAMIPREAGVPLQGQGGPAVDWQADFKEAKEQVVSWFEEKYISGLIDRADNNMTKAASIAGIDKKSLYTKLHKYGLGNVGGDDGDE